MRKYELEHDQVKEKQAQIIKKIEADNQNLLKIITTIENKLLAEKQTLLDKIERNSKKTQDLQTSLKKRTKPPPIDHSFNIDTFEDVRVLSIRSQEKKSPPPDENFKAIIYPFKDPRQYYLHSPKTQELKGKTLRSEVIDFFRNVDHFLNTKESVSQYKSSCLKDKHIVAENGTIKVGCLSGSPYGSEENNVLKLSIFIKNKTNRPLSPFSINFYDIEGST